MSNSDERELRRNLILVAAYLFRVAKPESKYVHCHRVLRHALTVMGRWNDTMYESGAFGAGCESDEFPEYALWYATLIEMTTEQPESQRLLDGFGNLETPAGSLFTACEATPLGRDRAHGLLRENPSWSIPLRW